MKADIWESLWADADREKLFSYLQKYDKYEDGAIAFLKDHGVKTVCDAACGFGAYTLALLSNGFNVKAFDISQKAADTAKEGLKRFGFDADIKSADILDTGYEDAGFDGVFAASVLDHMTRGDAEKALYELCRITRPGGLIALAFDKPEGDDLEKEHEILPDGSIRYESGMIFHPYGKAQIAELTRGFETVYEGENERGEQIVILKKRDCKMADGIRIEKYTVDRIPDVIDFELRLREEEDFWGWEIDEAYKESVKKSFSDGRFDNAIALLAYADGKVIGRIDAALIPTRLDGSVSAYLDWICVIKSSRHKGVGQALLEELKKELKEKGVATLVALTASNGEAQRFYKSVPDSEMKDTGIWIEIK